MIDWFVATLRHAPNWSVRVLFANLGDDVCDAIGRGGRAVARQYVDACQAQGGKMPKNFKELRAR
jgi:hypothetical protein